MTCLVLSVTSFKVCPSFQTASDNGDGLIFRFFRQKSRLMATFFIHHYLYTEVSLLSFSKRGFHLAACAFQKTASFRTQLSTYSRIFITSVDHVLKHIHETLVSMKSQLTNSGKHEISDLSLSLNTVYILGPRSE